MGQMFFVGAGFSAAAGYPVTSGLTHAIAHYISGYRVRHKKPSRLEEYLIAVYGVTRKDIEQSSKIWAAYLTLRDRSVLTEPSKLPDVIELLSVLDFSVQSGLSFGPSNSGDELGGRELSRIRERVLRAFVRCFSDIRRKYGLEKGAAIHRFAEIVHARNSTVLTTNWDMVLDDCLKTGACIPDYGIPSAILTNGEGNKILKPQRKGRLLKLHGSVNWLCCPRCGDLWINTDIATAPGAEKGSKAWFDRKSLCGAEMDGLMISPSFVRLASNIHLSNIASHAQRTLVESRNWAFIGYSLPDDDYWIRAMLLRARTIQRGNSVSPRVTVVYKGLGSADEALEKRYTKFFGDLQLKFVPHGLEAFVKQLQ